MASAEHMNHARNFLKKAQEYLAAAEDSLMAGRHTPAAGDAIHAGITAKDAIVTALTGTTGKNKNHAAAAGELKQALGRRPESPAAERALRELISAKSDVAYGVALVTAAKAEPLVRRAKSLVDLAVQIVRLGR
jgi:HEPN domain-containing protein